MTIDGWVYFDDQPTGYQSLVIKGNEYQLRLDDQREGGRFSFFVYLDGWEPRVSTTVPVAGKWYHLTAKWTGTDVSLTVNGDACRPSDSARPSQRTMHWSSAKRTAGSTS